MKKTLCLLTIAAFIFGCNEDIKVNDNKLDKLETAGKDLQKTVQKGVDTVASKIKKVKIKIED